MISSLSEWESVVDSKYSVVLQNHRLLSDRQHQPLRLVSDRTIADNDRVAEW